MLENERIIVQDRGGIDAGIAALMQNANKGLDPAALMGMMNNGGLGGNGSWWWIFIIVLFWMWGGWGNGMGRNGQSETNADFARLAAMGNVNNNTDLLMQAIQGNKDAINSLASVVNCDVKSISQAICALQGSVDKVAGEVGFSAERVINAVNAGDCQITKAISDCCCTTQRSIDAVNLNLTRMSYEDQLAMCNQTNTLVNTLNSNHNALISDNATKFNIISAKIDAQTTLLNDKFCQLEMREMQHRIDELREQNSQLALSASQQAQTANIVSQLKTPCPTPAYVVPNPNCCYGAFGGGFYNGYGDSCCA